MYCCHSDLSDTFGNHSELGLSLVIASDNVIFWLPVYMKNIALTLFRLTLTRPLDWSVSKMSWFPM